MSLDAKQTEQRPVGDVSELVKLLASAERRTGPLLLGLEHERLLFPKQGFSPIAYDGPSGVGAVMTAFAKFGFTEYREAPGLPVIAMQRGMETLSLEPGGQFELSGSPFATATEAHAEATRHAQELREVTASLGLRAVGLAYRPFFELGEMPWMPKTRYRVMRETLGTRGSHAFDMMLMTTTGQVSLDWRDEADCVRKVTAAVRISPLLVALFANSPIAQGKPTGFLSYRSRVWNDVDPARCGYPQAMLDGSFSYRAYVEWALDAPMLFVRRDGQYLNPKMTFRQFLAKGFEGRPATESDWADHLSTLFPEVRLKKIVEIRAADANTTAMTSALGALMRGVLYDAQALDEATRLLPKTTPDGHRALHHSAQRSGLGAPVGEGTLADFAPTLLGIARAGLQRLGGGDEVLLAPLEAIAERRRSPALDVLEHFAREPRPEVFLSRFEL
ncbi:MAG: glutamate--cysteine ligase [Myxococcota bacterium]